MEHTMIVSGLALLAATANLFLLWQEKKRNEKRNAAMIQYVDKSCEAVGKKIEDIGENVMNASGQFQDQLGETLASILAFDPVEAHRKARNSEKYGLEGD